MPPWFPRITSTLSSSFGEERLCIASAVESILQTELQEVFVDVERIISENDVFHPYTAASEIGMRIRNHVWDHLSTSEIRINTCSSFMVLLIIRLEVSHVFPEKCDDPFICADSGELILLRDDEWSSTLSDRRPSYLLFLWFQLL